MIPIPPLLGKDTHPWAYGVVTLRPQHDAAIWLSRGEP